MINLTPQQRLLSARNKIQIAIALEDAEMYLEAVSVLRELGWIVK